MLPFQSIEHIPWWRAAYENMSEVGRVTIETLARGGGIVHRLSATVNVGGSLVEVHLDSEQDHELRLLVDQLTARLRSLALQTIQATLKPEAE